MSNVTVQEALKSIELAEETGSVQYLLDALNGCKAALSEIDRCEPLGWYKQHPRLPEGFYETAWHWSTVGDDKRWKPFYTSPQAIDKCEPVAYISNDAKLPLTDDGSYWLYPEKLEYRIALYDKPQPRDWVVPSNEVIDTLWHKATHESVAHSEPFTRYRFSELLIKQLNTKG